MGREPRRSLAPLAASMRSVAHAACSTRPFAPRPTRCAVCRVGYSLPFITPPRPTDCRYAPSRGIRQPAGKFVLAYPWGAPRLRAAALSSLPAGLPFSPSGQAITLPLSTHPPPALGRVTAASYSGAALGASALRPRPKHCGAPLTRLSLRRRVGCWLLASPSSPPNPRNYYAVAPCA